MKQASLPTDAASLQTANDLLRLRLTEEQTIAANERARADALEKRVASLRLDLTAEHELAVEHIRRWEMTARAFTREMEQRMQAQVELEETQARVASLERERDEARARVAELERQLGEAHQAVALVTRPCVSGGCAHPACACGGGR